MRILYPLAVASSLALNACAHDYEISDFKDPDNLAGMNNDGDEEVDFNFIDGYPFSKVREACEQTLTNDSGHCVWNNEAGTFDVDCEKNVDAVAVTLLTSWYSSLSSYFGFEVNENNIDDQSWTVEAYYDDLEEQVASLAIAPGFHNSLHSNTSQARSAGPNYIFDPNLPIFHCEVHPYTDDINVVHSHLHIGRDVILEEEASFMSIAGTLVEINGIEYDCSTGEYGCDTSDSAGKRFKSKTYSEAKEITKSDVSGLAHF